MLSCFLEGALKLDSEIEKKLFRDYQEGEKIDLLFDAFDEILSEYKIEVIE